MAKSGLLLRLQRRLLLAAQKRSQSGGRPLSTTADLAALVANAVGKSRKDASQHPATRTFQAIRIHVNRELEELALALEQAAAMLATGGRSGRDQFPFARRPHRQALYRAHHHPERGGRSAARCRCARINFRGRRCGVARVVSGRSGIGRQPARAQSAVMRVAERTAEPWPGRPQSMIRRGLIVLLGRCCSCRRCRSSPRSTARARCSLIWTARSRCAAP